jgi:phosphate starvation-inducible protein PhoH and related proteins
MPRKTRDKPVIKNSRISKQVIDSIEDELESKAYEDNFLVKNTRAVKKDYKLVPMNKNQEKYINAIKNNDVTVAIGSAGTSKTFSSSVLAAQALKDKKIDKIIISRPTEGPGRALGTLPGTATEKIEPWLTPVLEPLKLVLGHSAVEYYLKKGQIEMLPLNLIKGRSFSDAFVLIDESEDIDLETIKSLLTRKGENCTMVISGDIKQKHIKTESGLGWLLYLIKKYQLPIPLIEFTIDDCVRSDFVKMMLKVFEKEDDKNL